MKNTHVVYFVKRAQPDKGRASFSIVAKHTPPLNGKRYTTFKDERVDALNRGLVSGGFSFENVEREVRLICDALNAAQKKKEQGRWLASSNNLKLLDQYWESEYSDRDIRKPETARRTLVWALTQIGSTPLLADTKTLQKIVNTRFKDNPRNQRLLCKTLNQMRKFFGITRERLKKARKPPPDFCYLTEEEFKKVLPYVREWRGISADTLRALFTVLFYSGVRAGEAYALRKHHLHGNQLKVATQIYRDGKEEPTKNGKIHDTFLCDKGLTAFHAFVKATDRGGVHRHSFASCLREACGKAFPNDPSKWITVHDLRHSYAVWCLTVLHLSIEDIAKLLGDTIAVCEEYYLAFERNNDHMVYIAEKARRSLSS